MQNGAQTVARLRLTRKDVCQITGADRAGMVLPNAMVGGYFDGKGQGYCVAVGTVDGQLHIAKQGRIWVEQSGFGDIHFLVVVQLSTHDVLLVFSGAAATLVDVRGGNMWTSKLALEGFAQGPRCCAVADTVENSFFSIVVGFASGRLLQYGVTFDTNRAIQSMARTTQQWVLPEGPVKSVVCGAPTFLAAAECGVFSLSQNGDVVSTRLKGHGSIESANIVGNQIVTVRYSPTEGQWLDFSSGWTIPMDDLPVLCPPRVTTGILPNAVPSVIVCCYNGETYLMDEARNVLRFSLEESGIFLLLCCVAYISHDTHIVSLSASLHDSG